MDAASIRAAGRGHEGSHVPIDRTEGRIGGWGWSTVLCLGGNISGGAGGPPVKGPPDGCWPPGGSRVVE
jgi:hypothetical protein